jgi:hypothetical protein
MSDASRPGFFPLALSPDGSLMAIPETDSANQTHLVVHGLSSPMRYVVQASIANQPAFSPNAGQLAWFDPGILSLQIGDLKGGAVHTVTRARGVGGIAWLTDSSLVYSGGGGSLFRWSQRSEATDTLLAASGDSLQYFQPWSSGNGLIILGVGGNRADARTALARNDLEIAVFSVSKRRLGRLGVRGLSPALVDGNIVTYLRDGGIWGVTIDTATLQLEGNPRLIADGSGARREITSYDVSSNGVLVLRRGAVGDARQLLIVDRDGAARVLAAELRPYRSARFSPDGHRLVYTLARTASTGGDVWTMNLADGRRLRITSDSASLAPEWSPDGSAILFVRLRRVSKESMARIDRIQAQASGDPKPLLQRSNQIYEFQVTPDGKRILWREDAQITSRDIYVASVDSPTVARPLRATSFDERGVALSPDGKWYLYSSTESGATQVYVARLDGDGSRWPVSGEGGTEPRWAKNGEAFFRSRDSVYVTRIALGETPRIDPPRALFGGNYMATGYEPVWDVSPDGKRFAMVRVQASGSNNVELMVNWIRFWQAKTK